MAGQTVDAREQSSSPDYEKAGKDVNAPRLGSLDNPEGLSYAIDTNREEDFYTRNGLNLKSFQRRKSTSYYLNSATAC